MINALNNIRYAVFPHRLAVELNGEISVYDTLNHNIGGVSQQQGGDTSLNFSSQFGTIAVTSLPIISGPGKIPSVPQTNFAVPDPIQNDNSTPEAIEPVVNHEKIDNIDSSDAIIQLIEKLAKLHEIDVLSDEEFNSKKTEILSRI